MLECKEVRPLLADYEAGNLPAEQAGQVADHLLLCPICAAALEELRREKDRPAAAPSPVAPRSLGTQDPLAEQKAAAAAPEQSPAPAEETVEQESVATQTTEIAPARKLRLRTVVFLGLAVLLVLVGVCAGILYSRGFFDIRDWAKSEDGRLVAVVYEGTEDGEDGFRIRLWDTKEKGWYDERAFLDSASQAMQWSPNGVYLAVEHQDQENKTQVTALAMLEEGVRPISMHSRLKSEMNATFGYLGKALLEDVPSCKILGWTDDGSGLLMWAEGAEGPVDPDYGIELADLGNAVGSVSGILMYNVNTYALEVMYGFGIRSSGQQESRNNQLKNRFFNFMSQPGMAFMQQERETVFGEEALLKLHQVAADGGVLHVCYDLGSTSAVGFIFADTDLSVLTQLESAEDVMLVLCREQYRQDLVQEAFLILPYLGVAQ